MDGSDRENERPRGKATLIVDDSEQVRQHIRDVAASISGIDIVAEAADAPTAIRLVTEKRPDIVILDLQLADGTHGLDVLVHVKSLAPAPKVVVLSANVHQGGAVRRALRPAEYVLDKVMDFHLLEEILTHFARSGEQPVRTQGREGKS